MLEKEKEKAITREVMAAVTRSKELKSDFLALGDMLYRQYPEVWEKIKHNWRDEWLPNVEVRVSVTSKMRRSGATSEPIHIHSQ
ncbi:MAG TPA: hypothetical protein GXX19_05515 [Syntrophomonadaceae bacterium]|nr:hypothetical protein [Syntrophomonadaceae bacterium]